MSDVQELGPRRYVSPARLVGAFACFAAAAAVGLSTWSLGVAAPPRVTLALLALPVVLGLGLLASAVRRGCAGCRQTFVTSCAAFPPELHEVVAEAVRRGGVEPLRELRALSRVPPSGDVALLRVERCPSCGCGALHLERGASVGRASIVARSAASEELAVAHTLTEG